MYRIPCLIVYHPIVELALFICVPKSEWHLVGKFILAVRGGSRAESASEEPCRTILTNRHRWATSTACKAHNLTPYQKIPLALLRGGRERYERASRICITGKSGYW